MKGLSELSSGTIVVLPSISFPTEELRKIIGIERYEERMMFMLLLLANPDIKMVYLSSMRLDEPIVDYYLRFVPDSVKAGDRLFVISFNDPTPRALSEKVLEDAYAIKRLQELGREAEDCYILPFNVTELEAEIAERSGIPLYGPRTELVHLGSKSGARRVARGAGVPILDGAEELRSVTDVEKALAELRSQRPDVSSVVMKLNDGFSGQGNAILDISERTAPLTELSVVFCATEESWATYVPKIAEQGVVIEQRLRAPGVVSPSVQMRIAPNGEYEIVSTHDQVLGGPDDQVYLGCRFPARSEYRKVIQDHACAVAAELARRGVIGSFGIDFIIDPDGTAYLSEINLRMGGTTHPFLMARFVTEGTYDQSNGELIVDGIPKSYVSTDNLKNESYVGLAATDVIGALDDTGLGFDRSTGTGATLHLLGALRPYGKLGVLCIANSPEEAEELYEKVVSTIDEVARSASP